MVVAGIVEKARRDLAKPNSNNPLGVAPMSAMWLAVPLVLMGMCEAFNAIGMVEFFNRQCPEHMRSISNSLLSCSWGVGSYLSSFIITVVNRRTRWLTNDLNDGRLEFFYYLIAGLEALNLAFFLFVARRYQYTNFKVQDNDDHVDDYANNNDDVELAAIKSSV